LTGTKQPSTFGAKRFIFYAENRIWADADVCYGGRIVPEQDEPERVLPVEEHLDKLFLLLAEEIPTAGTN